MTASLAQVRSRIARSAHNAILDLTTVTSEDVLSLPTGSFLLDQATGVGGYPFGRIVELFGPESCGKSTSALHAIAAAQNPDINPTGVSETCMYIDYEHDFDIAYARKLGVDINLDKLIYIQPDTFEEGMTCALPFIKEGLVRVVVVDSVAAMLPADDQPELAKSSPSVGQAKQPMTQARLMANMLRQLRPVISNTGVVMIFLNQTSEVIDLTPYGSRMKFKKISTPGGRRLKFYSALRVEFRPIGGIKGRVRDLTTGQTIDQVVATKVKATVVKNKVSAPFHKAEFIIRYGVGIDDVLSMVHCGISRSLIMKNRSVYVLHTALSPSKDQLQLVGVNAVADYFRQNPDKMLILRKAVKGLIDKERGQETQVETIIDDDDDDE